MTHRRKEFLVYPPNYRPGALPKYRSFKSRKAAAKQAERWGESASVDVSINVHDRPHTRWVSSFGKPLFTIVRTTP